MKTLKCMYSFKGFPGSSAGKESACNIGEPSSIPGVTRSPGEGAGYPLQRSWAALVAQTVKNPPAIWDLCLIPGLGKSWRKEWLWYPWERMHMTEWVSLSRPHCHLESTSVFKLGSAWFQILCPLSTKLEWMESLIFSWCCFRDTCFALLSCVRLFGTPWTVACQAPVFGILHAWILKWVAISFSSRFFCSRDQTWVSCIGDRFFTS